MVESTAATSISQCGTGDGQRTNEQLLQDEIAGDDTLVWIIIMEIKRHKWFSH